MIVKLHVSPVLCASEVGWGGGGASWTESSHVTSYEPYQTWSYELTLHAILLLVFTITEKKI